jgi:YesN/AraC family two-component response regulator
MNNIPTSNQFERHAPQLLDADFNSTRKLDSKVNLVHVAVPESDFVANKSRSQHMRNNQAKTLKGRRIFIKNMVSLRCKMMVKAELEKLGVVYKSIELGEVQLVEPITKTTMQKLKVALNKSGLNLMYDEKIIMIEKIINIVIEMVHYSDELPTVNFSIFLSKKMKKGYHKMAKIFSKTKGMTIEHFIILHKVEKIKELIIYGELNLSEISYKMHYSSAAHLSRQFKQVTGSTPTFYKSLPKRERVNLEDL